MKLERVPPHDGKISTSTPPPQDRAYVTLAGMYPNTTYYVKIRKLSADFTSDQSQGQDIGQGQGEGHVTEAMVVVKTMPLNNGKKTIDLAHSVSLLLYMTWKTFT